MAASISSNTQSVGGNPNAAQQASIAKHDNEHFSPTLCRWSPQCQGVLAYLSKSGDYTNNQVDECEGKIALSLACAYVD